ncbi:galactokinase [Pectinatus cerevisiiphilus]|uniref:Galactokinase n=1 Tax=Pectinatus cerevisiiphilus TaxID=86956 RepID=A0A4R3KBK9_9FIRM|nr:galactokinase [Pectinatus cerevisiiphilus]TCS80448.1 galactokinase [Pectinatus cerevisiiphilus]
MDIVEEIKKVYKEKFKEQAQHIFYSPGRVNLIGEHTDYNGGHVFPCAISLGTYGAASLREDKKICFYSLNLPEKGIITADVEKIANDKANDWANYPLGVVKTFQNHGFKVNKGFNLVIYGNLPDGAGLSSSASLEMLTAMVLKKFFSFVIDTLDMVKFCQEAENKFVGVNCGILDQFAVGMGKKDNAMLLDCNTLKYRYVKILLKGYSIVITNTNCKHSLVDSAYNLRRSQCEQALADIQKKRNVKSLGELNEDDFAQLQTAIKDPVCMRRARHAVFENQRTIKAVTALENNDLELFGHLMNESHKSLRDDYEVTGPELDALAELAWQQDGVIGSRMTGGGFGGCTVSIVRNDCIDAFKKNVSKGYVQKIGYKPDFYIANIGDGTKVIE